MSAVKRYLSDLCERFGQGWNRFWFAPSDAFGVSAIRVIAGLLGLYFVMSHSADLVHWFGPNGILRIETAREITGLNEAGAPVFRFSYFYLFDSPAALWTAHVAGIAVLLMMTVGLFTRPATILSLVVVLAYVHRAPMIAGQMEPVLTMLLFYLCFAPVGKHLSLDRWRTAAKARKQQQYLLDPAGEKSYAATVTVRLMQVHLAALYVMMGLAKLRGIGWWTGEALWGLMAYTESRLIDFSFLHGATYLLNLWTHAIVAFELIFPILIWNKTARPLLLAIAVVMWGSLALVSGLVAFCVTMMLANLVFVSPDGFRAVARSVVKRATHAREPQDVTAAVSA